MLGGGEHFTSRKEFTMRRFAIVEQPTSGIRLSAEFMGLFRNEWPEQAELLRGDNPGAVVVFLIKERRSALSGLSLCFGEHRQDLGGDENQVSFTQHAVVAHDLLESLARFGTIPYPE